MVSVPAGRSAPPSREAALFGWPVSGDDLETHLARLERAPGAGRGARALVTMNLDHVVRLRRDPEFRAAYAAAATVTLDGFPVWAYARLRGHRLPRCAGSDLFATLYERLDPRRHRPFFLVGGETVAAELLRRLRERGFADEAAAFVPPGGFHADAPCADAAVAAIRAHRPSHLIVGLGAPRSEIFLARRGGELGDLHALAVGAAPDFVAGVRRRAPPLLRRIGLEWLWRLACEPRRLARRYLIDAWGFVPAVLEDLRGARGDVLAAE